MYRSRLDRTRYRCAAGDSPEHREDSPRNGNEKARGSHHGRGCSSCDPRGADMSRESSAKLRAVRSIPSGSSDESLIRTGQLALVLGTASAQERSEAWTAEARKAMASLCAQGAVFSAENVRALVGDPPGGGAAMGALFRHVSQEGWIVPAGFSRTTRPQRRRSVLGLWKSAT
jgi:hypothetical protein